MKHRKHTSKLLSVLLLLIMATATLQAQESLKINSVFEKYGKKKGSIMVVLSGETLNNYRLDVFRSLTIKYDKTILDEIQNCIESDKKEAREIKEVINNGIITSGYYQLPKKDNPENRYILFKIGNDKTATLIYMEGGKDSEEMINNLFIKKK